MKSTDLSRDEMIDRLIDKDISGYDLVSDLAMDLLLWGWKGYANMTDEEIEEIYNETFEDCDEED